MAGANRRSTRSATANKWGARVKRARALAVLLQWRSEDPLMRSRKFIGRPWKPTT